ncbi:MAG: HAD family hydrolase [Chitinispirillaceae bacterium]|nr:HAD family hydrolase [Chitinispirillaceae bacterium]
MSPLAEYARELHETDGETSTRHYLPVDIAPRSEHLYDIRAVVFDIYGTLVDYWRPGLDDRGNRPNLFKEACRKVAERFLFTDYLLQMNPEEDPGKTLYDLYCGLIALRHAAAAKKGISYPEVKIEEIWNVIHLMLKRRGYNPAGSPPGTADDIGRYLAYTYNFYSLGRKLYPGTVRALESLKRKNIVIGIVSNAQFYTPIDLTLLIREQSIGVYDDVSELFDQDLTFFSYEYGVAKPDVLLFRKLFDALYELQIMPAQTVFAGNDLLLDIAPAQTAGMKTALFTGDRQSLFLHDKADEITPDITFRSLAELPEKLSFYTGGNETL